MGSGDVPVGHPGREAAASAESVLREREVPLRCLSGSGLKSGGREEIQFRDTVYVFSDVIYVGSDRSKSALTDGRRIGFIRGV